MGRISVVQRKVNKGSIQPIYVRYNHTQDGQSKDFFAPTSVSVEPIDFKAGRVVNRLDTVELNGEIQEVYIRMERALRMAKGDGKVPTVAAVKGCYQYYLKQPAYRAKARAVAHDMSETARTDVLQQQMEVEELLAMVEEKRAKIIELQKLSGDYKQELISVLIDQYIEARRKQKPKTQKRSKKSFSTSTERQYRLVKEQLLKYNPALSIRAIDKEALDEIEEFLVRERYLNTTTRLFMQKFATIVRHYQEAYGLSNSFREYTFDLPLREENVIYLTTAELKAFRVKDLTEKNKVFQRAAERVRDLALLMSETALRYCDSALKPEDIQAGYIVKNQQKTGGKVHIPFTNRLKALLEKHDYKLKGGKLDNFNATFRRILSTLDVPSLHEEVTVTNYIGLEPVHDTKAKYLHCGAHTLRRTMINQCLLRNLRYDQITKITGHKDFDAFQTYVDRDTRVAEMDVVFDFLNETAQDPVLRIA